MGRAVKDNLLKGTRALPAAAGATVDGGAIDLGHGSKGDFLVPCEVKITAPAVNTTMAPDTRTFKYSLIHSDNADLSSPTVLLADLMTQTGAGGAGAVTNNVTVALPVDVKRYIGVRVVSGASTADASAVSATIELLM